MSKLTKTLVDRELPTDKERFLWDSEIKGFGLKIFPTGAKTFVFQYRAPEGQSRRYTIGKLSEALTTDQARKLAKDLAFEVHEGRDPMAQKQQRRNAITVGDLLDDYLKSEAFLAKAISTQGTDRGRVERHLRPLLGSEIADRLSGERVRKAHREITEGKTAAKVKTIARGLARVTGGEGTANKAVLLLSAAYKWGMEHGLVKVNPVNMKEAWRSGQRDTILEDSGQYKALFTTLDRMQNEKQIRPAVADAIRLIALTGARRGEVTGLRWAWVDLKTGFIAIPPSGHKTGKKTGKVRYIALPAEAQEIIARQPRDEDAEGYVFKPSKGEGVLSLNKPWRAVRKAAGLPEGLVLHGLRHSIGSHLAMAGGSSVELMETLGHTNVSTTQRYIHYAERARSNLAERAAAVALAGMKIDEL